MNRTLLDECFRVKGREHFYLAIAEIQQHLDEYMAYYNLERSHQGYRLNGRTPAKALRDALGIEPLPNLRFESASDDAASTFTSTEEVDFDEQTA